MRSTLSRAVGPLAAVLALVAGLALWSAVGPSSATPAEAAVDQRADHDRSDRGSRGGRVVTVDIAENGHRFVFDEAPVVEDGDFAGFPAYGNAFVTRGYIYPANTLDGTDGVNPDGSPEFPDKVIGEWVCKGYFINDEGMGTTEGVSLYTTQMFAFGDNARDGAETIVVTGYESGDVGAPYVGAITGGTGAYMTARGEASQTLLGVNNPEAPTMGIDKRVTFTVRR
jgi:hypothetical protein